MADAICRGDIKAVGKALYNKFEEVVEVPKIDVIKSYMKKYGAEGTIMTGSGSAIFGIFEEKSDADDCVNELERHFENVWLTEPVSECQVIK